MIRKRDETRNFFADMEQNILSKIRGEERPEPSQPEGERRDSDDGFHNGRPRRSSVGGIRLVRTISTIDGRAAWMLCIYVVHALSVTRLTSRRMTHQMSCSR